MILRRKHRAHRTANSFVLLVLNGVTLTAAAAPPEVAPGAAAAEMISAQPGDSYQKTALTALPKNAQLMHKVVQVSVGAVGRVTVALFRSSPESTVYQGKVLIPQPDAEHWRVTPLPPMREADGLFDITVLSVFATPAGYSRAGLVVLYTYRRFGSTDDPANAAYVYLWDGHEWTIDKPATRRLVGLGTATKAREALAKH